jgi:FKBP-type peptidyl-prolyl cis-trans isomerase FkpA
LIQGVEEGLTYMKEGGTAKLLIPSSLGYGNSGYNFPAWTPLLFELKITRLVPAEKK